MRYRTKRRRRNKISTLPPRGNTIQNKHFRLRECNQNFTPTQAEMHTKIYIPPSQEYNPEATVPLAEMQSKYCIPTSWDFVIILVHGPC